MRRWWVRLLAVVVVVALLLLGAAFLLTNSNWGRERIRRYVVGVLQNNSHGIIHIGSVSGNLMNGFTMHDVVITDSAHAPFVKADEIWARYSIGTLRGKKIDFREVRLVRPVIVIDKQPGGKWNYDRIFPRDTVTRAGVKKTGWGTWIRFSDVTVLDGDLTVRAPWEPDPKIAPPARRDAVRRALGPEGRLKIIQVAKGYQHESSFHHINGLFPLVLHPNGDAGLAALQAFLDQRQYVLPIAFRDELLVARDTLSGPVVRQVADPGDRFWDVLTWRLADGR